MIRTEKNTKGRKAAETKTEERPIQAVLSRVDVIMPVGRSQLEGQAILRERERRDEGPTSTAKWIDPSRWTKTLSLFTPTHRPNTLFH